jgi:hypothetical protein
VVTAPQKAKPDRLPSLREGSTLVLTFRIVTTGQPEFLYGYGPDNPCLTPASARPFLWKQGQSFVDPYARWWSRIAIPLESVPDARTLRIALDPAQWSSVNGKLATDPDARDGWVQTLANPGSIGLTAGGGCFYGHGVTVRQGTAHFELVAYSVE